jgi:2'-5' RNA ligase
MKISKEQAHPGDMLRTFFAIELDQATRDACDQIILFLRKYYPVEKIKWIKTANLHITLRFIGATSHLQIPVLIDHVRKALTNVSAFQLDLGEIAFFPLHRPHVIVIHFNLSQKLVELLSAVEQAVVACGFAPETRPFQPHLTLARLLHRPHPLPEIPVKLPQTLVVNKVVLFQSQLTPDGSVYTPLECFLL